LKVNDVVKSAPPSALVFTRRAELSLKLGRPVAAIRDCDEALKLNPDSGKAYRVRGYFLVYCGVVLI
jgi:suppressor of tumorigenicity protein 13